MVAFFERLSRIDDLLQLGRGSVASFRGLIDEPASALYLYEAASEQPSPSQYELLLEILHGLRADPELRIRQAASRGWIDYLTSGDHVTSHQRRSGVAALLPIGAYEARRLASAMAKRLPPDEAAGLIPALCSAISEGSIDALHEKDLLELSRRLLEASESLAAYALVEAIVEAGTRSRRRAQVHELVTGLPLLDWPVELVLPGLTLYVSMLVRVFESSGRESPRDHSRIWLESVGKAETRAGIEEALAIGLRDLAVQASRSLGPETVVRYLRAHPWDILDRIACYVASRFAGDVSPELVVDIVISRDVYSATEAEVELRSLLTEMYPRLDQEERAQIHGWIAKLRSEIQRSAAEHSHERADAWERDWLSALGAGELPPDLHSRLHALESQLGPYRNPGPRIRSGFVRQMSPIDADQLEQVVDAASLDRLVAGAIESLESQSPRERQPGLFEEVSLAGLADQLRRFVSRDVGRWLDRDAIQASPDILGESLYRAAYEALEAGGEGDPESIAALSHQIVASAPAPAELGDGTRRWLLEALRRAAGHADIRHRARIREVADEALRASTGTQSTWADPATQSINEPVGLATHLLFELLLQSKDGAQDDHAELWSSLKRSSEELDSVRRAVWGQWFPVVVHEDEEAARLILGALFLPDGLEEIWRSPAWSAYLRFGGVDRKTMDLLAPVYLSAARQLVDASDAEREDSSDDAFEWASRHFAEHLAIAMVQGEGEDEDPTQLRPAVEAFLELAPLPLRQHLFEFLARSLSDSPSIDSALMEKVVKVIRARAETLGEGTDGRELGEIGWIMEADPVPVSDRLRIVLLVLRSGVYVEPDHVVFRSLRDHAVREPGLSVQVVRLMTENITEEWQPHSWAGEARDVLERCMSSNPSLRLEVAEAADNIGRFGLLVLRDVYEAAVALD